MAPNNNILRHFLIPALVFLYSINPLSAQQVKYWVKFTDKNGTPYSVASPGVFLTQKAIQRRTLYGIGVDQSDLPVTPAYVQKLAGLSGVNVLYASKWLNGAVIAMDASAAAQVLSAVSGFSFVENHSKVNRYVVRLPVPDAKSDETGKLSSAAGFNYGGSGGQIRQLGVDCLHEKGFRGQGITIAVCDVGFNNVNTASVFDSLRNRGGIIGTRDFVDGGPNAYTGGSHGTMVLSCMAAINPGQVMGTAPLSDYWLLRTEEGARETISEEYNWIRAAEFADSVGADIITTSLGYTQFDDAQQNHTYASLNGRTAPMSIAATMAARKGIFVLNAAGNEGGSGWKYISVPGDADSICTVGAVDTLGVLAGFSSVGPTSDGRIKPDLVACGAGAWICDGGGACYPANGTSFATPVLAGAVACYWQANRKYSNIKVLRILKKYGSRAENPDNNMGWGIPRLCTSEAAGLPVILGADVTASAAANGTVTVKAARPKTGGGGIDTVQKPGPYRLSLLHRTSSQATYSRIAGQPKTYVYQLDTLFTHPAIDTESEQRYYAIEFIAGNDTIGKSKEASTVFLSAAQDEGKVKLSWTSKTPWINHSYEIQRKPAGASAYSKLTVTDGTNYTDASLAPGTSYCYRVVSEGQYSDVSLSRPLLNSSQEACVTVTVQPVITEPFGVVAHIDPATSQATIWLSAGDHRDITVEMFDMLGRRLLNGTASGKGTIIRLDASSLARDVYFIKVSSSLGSKVIKTVKL
jgi:serine protease AprX